MKKRMISLVMALALLVPVLPIAIPSASAQRRQAQNDMRVDSRRALSLGKCYTKEELPEDVRALLEGFPQYVDEATSLNGMEESTSTIAGWDVVAVLNEVPGVDGNPDRFCYSLLRPNVKVFTLNGEAKPLRGYLFKCRHATIKGFMNRIIVPPPKLKVEKGETVEIPCRPDETGYRLVDRKVADNGDIEEAWYDGCNYKYKYFAKQAAPPPQFLAVCPADIRTTAYTSKTERFAGGLWDLGVSVAGSEIATAIQNRGFDWGTFKDVLIRDVPAQRISHGINPGEDRVRVYIPTDDGKVKEYEVKKGEKKTLVGTIGVDWINIHMFVTNKIALRPGDAVKTYVCGSTALKQVTNWVFWPLDDGFEPIKTVPTIPGTNTPTGPQRPRVIPAFAWVPTYAPLTWAEVQSDRRFYADAESGTMATGSSYAPGFGNNAAPTVSEPAVKKSKFQVGAGISSN